MGLKRVRILAGLVVVFAAAAAGQDTKREPIDVWMDVDTATGEHERDVDDGLAMIQAFHSPELRVRGVSTVYGNANLPNAHRIAQEIVTRFGPDNLDVHRGAASKEELGEPTEAVGAMAAALDERPLTILALGPLTNTGSLLKLHPELHARIKALVIVAGRRPGQRFAAYRGAPNAFPDFNFENDPEAMRIILDSDVPLVMAPWEVSSHVWITPADLERLSAGGGSGAWIAEKSRSWIARWMRDPKVTGFTPFDTLAVAWLTHPHLIESMEVGAWIEEGADDLVPAGGAPRTKPYLLVDPESKTDRSIIYTYFPDESFKEILIKRLGAPGSIP